MNNSSVPRSVGIILDGNRRWAKARNLPTLEGHRRGAEKLKELISWSNEAGIGELILYAFSTENWNRAPEEVAYLMDLFVEFFGTWKDEAKKQKVRIRFIGERGRFSPKVQEVMTLAEEETKDGTSGILTFALSYGGRAEILDAVNTLLAKDREQVTEEELRGAMWSAGLSDPDIIIRTGGEKRLSNFLTWQSVYSELFFIDTQLPDFSKEEFNAILAEYAERERRHGK
ncbi:MAG: di-trans,poly-cis-decaprenylcistransferase [Parcubacteria bacterium C7867-001]|nr:MAG: di-trans,poly-cis-decaprenylcistransferase [Parcubacteria bacterium C7867-001]